MNFMVLDIETTNSIDDNLAYDIGFIIANEKGKILRYKSLLIKDVFENDELMESAFYKDKLYKYLKLLAKNKTELVTLHQARKLINKLIKKYSIKKVYAYNGSFDRKGLNKTLRYITKSKYRWFLPYSVEFCDIWHMASQTICDTDNYVKWCYDNGKYRKKTMNISTSAETVFAYLNDTSDFEEEHMGLQDCFIELEILLECFKYGTDIDDYCNSLSWRIPQARAKRYRKRVDI